LSGVSSSSAVIASAASTFAAAATSEIAEAIEAGELEPVRSGDNGERPLEAVK